MIEHSKHYKKLKIYFQRGLWNVTRMRNAVDKMWITISEFEEITGISYDGGAEL